MALEFVGCIGGCDETLREVLNLRYLRGGDSGAQVNQTSVSRQSNPPIINLPLQSRSENRPPPSRPNADSSRHPQLNPTQTWSLQPPSTVQSNAVVCNCGQDALLLTVRKEGPNQGREFYKCNTGNCNFFLWADQPNDDHGHAGSRGPVGRGSQPPRPSLGFGNTPQQRPGNRGSAGDGGETMCNCNEPAVQRTVMKDGPNKGKMFHTCGKPRDQQCGFFQWVDENVAPGN